VPELSSIVTMRRERVGAVRMLCSQDSPRTRRAQSWLQSILTAPTHPHGPHAPRTRRAQRGLATRRAQRGLAIRAGHAIETVDAPMEMERGGRYQERPLIAYGDEVSRGGS
jgi:hypothetical protein